MTEPDANACRFRGAARHVESYFVRANDPTRPRAFWLKQTVLAPEAGPAVAESWFIWFDGERHETIAKRVTHSWASARFEAPRIETPSLVFQLSAIGSARGAFEVDAGKVSLDVGWNPTGDLVAEPLALLPWKLLREGPFPKSKLLTPYPSLRWNGTVALPHETVDVAGWHGMQGHNWGREHAYEYAWGQCLFPQEEAMVEGFTGRVRVAGRTTPRLSAMVVRRRGRTYGFQRLFDPWRQEASIETDRWTVRLRSRDGDAELTMDARQRPVACLGYTNPDGTLAYCLNSKLAAVELRVFPSDGAAFTCTSEHGGALEFLGRTRDSRFAHAV